MTKTLRRCWAGLASLVALFLLAAVGLTVFTPSDAHAAPAVAQRQPMRVFGENTTALQLGIAYWNGLAGYTVLEYDGAMAPAGDDASTVTVQVSALPVGLAGLTQGNVGLGALTVSVDPLAQSDWVVFAHELGHTLGVGHHDEAGYHGVMRTVVPPASEVHRQDDRRFVR
jgi:reprolysin-like metallo-peptidase family M12B